MTNAAGPIYEVTLTIDPDVIDEFDAWLAEHVREMLALPGFIEAKVYSIDDDEGRPRRVTQYVIDTEEHLEQYLAGPATEMRRSGVELFGDRFSASRRILNATEIQADNKPPPKTCLNCNSILTGQYCGQCGQRGQSRLISLWELVRDAFGDIFELDSRIWRTLLPLLFRPGKLTRDYLEGRRARFMPPFRTYLVLSVLFFVVLLFDPRGEFGLFFEPEPEQEQEQEQAAEKTTNKEDAQKVREQVLKDLADEGIIVAPGDDGAGDNPVADETWNGPTISINGDAADGGCKIDDEDSLAMPAWLSRRLTPERLQAVCDKIEADSGKSILRKLQDNIPAALFILLPLMAFVLKLSYPLSKRYYVEHLLFVVHFHAFIFLALTLMVLFARGAERLNLPSAVPQLVLVASSFYIPIYLYKAMRRVYMQGHLITIPKYLFLIVAYFAGLGTIFAITLLLAAFSI